MDQNSPNPQSNAEGNILEQIADACGGTIEDVTILSDGHGFALGANEASPR